MLHNPSQGFLNPIKRLAMWSFTTTMPQRAWHVRQARGAFIWPKTKHKPALGQFCAGFVLNMDDLNISRGLRSTAEKQSHQIPTIMETQSSKCELVNTPSWHNWSRLNLSPLSWLHLHLESKIQSAMLLDDPPHFPPDRFNDVSLIRSEKNEQ